MGPLHGTRIVEMAGIGPGPFCAMLLGDLGADVIRIDRIGDSDRGVDFPPKFDLLNRNKRSVAIDLKSPRGMAAALRLIALADVLIEGYRPGVMEHLGLGPAACHAANPRLVFGRPGQPPTIPLNLIGDFGGGSLYLAMGILAALLEARASGKGQVVDASIVDGTASLMTMQFALKQMGAWPGGRGENLIDGGAPFYDVYATKDGQWVSIAPVEKKFYAELLSRLGLSGETLPAQHDRAGWTQLRARLRDVFNSRTRREWVEALEGTDACFAPVLDMDECVSHPHNIAREVFVEVDGVINPAPAPRFSRTPGALRRQPSARGADTSEVLAEWGFPPNAISELRECGAIA